LSNSSQRPPLGPRHVAVIMDGNGRWAQQRNRPRSVGHHSGVRAARRAVRAAHRNGVEVLTVYAFSQENWQRPTQEVDLLFRLFLRTLAREVESLHRNGIQLRFIGDHSGFPLALLEQMRLAVEKTRNNTELTLVVAVGYGGQWDIVQAARRAVADGVALDAAEIEQRLDTAGLPPADLLVRTGGERRISNFLLWQLAYAELYFCDTLWPDFGDAEFDAAIEWFRSRQRRFGRVLDAVPASA